MTPYGLTWLPTCRISCCLRFQDRVTCVCSVYELSEKQHIITRNIISKNVVTHAKTCCYMWDKSCVCSEILFLFFVYVYLTTTGILSKYENKNRNKIACLCLFCGLRITQARRMQLNSIAGELFLKQLLSN